MNSGQQLKELYVIFSSSHLNRSSTEIHTAPVTKHSRTCVKWDTNSIDEESKKIILRQVYLKDTCLRNKPETRNKLLHATVYFSNSIAKLLELGSLWNLEDCVVSEKEMHSCKQIDMWEKFPFEDGLHWRSL